MSCCEAGVLPKRRWLMPFASGAGLFALLLPKCPMCVVAYLSVLGLSAGALGAASGALGVIWPLMRPLGWLLVGCGSALWLWRCASRRGHA